MLWYDIQGNSKPEVYDISGNRVANTFSVVEREEQALVIMTYNVQFWQESAKNGNKDRLDTILNKYNPDILGIQEHLKTATLNEGTPIGDYLAGRFADVELGGTTHSSGNYMNVVASTHELKDTSTVYFSQGGRRNYQKMYIELGGVRIAVFNTHLYWSDTPANGNGAETRGSQAEELFAAVQEEPYAIVMGDLNVLEKSTEAVDYVNIIKPFIDAGYNCANPSAAGFLDTCFEDEDKDGVLETYPTDNIITTPNIRIDRVEVDYTKSGGEYPTGALDHLPLVAYVTVT